MSVYLKLMQVQGQLKAPKGQFNSFGKYSYRNCEDILEALKPILTDVKAVVVLSDEVINIEGRFYVKATARFVDAETGEVAENTALAREDETKKGMDLAQVTGSCSSYARKYALNGLFAIDDTKDSDFLNQGANNNTTKSNSLDATKVKLLVSKALEKGYSEQQVLTMCKKKYGVNAIKEINVTQFKAMVDGFENLKVKEG